MNDTTVVGVAQEILGLQPRLAEMHEDIRRLESARDALLEEVQSLKAIESATQTHVAELETELADLRAGVAVAQRQVHDALEGVREEHRRLTAEVSRLRETKRIEQKAAAGPRGRAGAGEEPHFVRQVDGAPSGDGRMSYHYPDVPGICEALQAEGLTVSIDRVRQRRGEKGGSNEYISHDIKLWKREHGLLPDEPTPAPALVYTLPDPDPAAVAAHLAELREATAMVLAKSHLRAIVAGIEALRPLATLPCDRSRKSVIGSWLDRQFYRRHQPSGPGGLSVIRPPWRARHAADTMGSMNALERDEGLTFGTFSRVLAYIHAEEEAQHHDGPDRPAA